MMVYYAIKSELGQWFHGFTADVEPKARFHEWQGALYSNEEEVAEVAKEVRRLGHKIRIVRLRQAD